MNKKQIKQNFKEEKKQIKTQAKQQKQQAKQKYNEQLKNCFANEKKCDDKPKKPVVNPPKRTVLEEVGNAVTHGVGSLFAVFALVLMLVHSDTTQKVIAACVYAFGMVVLFTMSCLYHSFRHGSAVKRLFHRFDYSSIYLLIGATFTPVLLCFFGDLFGYVFFGVQWAIIACGITFVGVFGPSRLSFLHIPLYVLLGWSALMLLPGIISVNFPLAMYILGGGILYTLGLIPFLLRSRVSHFIWHFFVLAGAVVQWIGIYLYLFKN